MAARAGRPGVRARRYDLMDDDELAHHWGICHCNGCPACRPDEGCEDEVTWRFQGEHGPHFCDDCARERVPDVIAGYWFHIQDGTFLEDVTGV